MIKRDSLIQLLNYTGLKKPLGWLHFKLQTIGLPKITPSIVRALPHDQNAYTQGLAFHQGQLYESTGLVGASRLRQLDRLSGAVQQEININHEWCEGIAILNNQLVQLTYTSGKTLNYNPNNLERLSNGFSFKGEGWGLASCNGGYVMSNGSDELVFRNEQFIITSILPVTMNDRPLDHINDLECVGDKIYANVQFHNHIYEIDRFTGKVLRVINCQAIIARSGRRDFQDMLNGIAYLPETETFYVTGKNWPTLFEISIP
ncbi:glutaminyl-peptide cyclotransferase [Nitrosomonas sp.]|uniref:glutaminyl-peptide cyclotransferase n=1 Tax=Nitrosomonas sp. TaxID=42353 RepID=UPI00284DE357|nr:glutaminyl-peptide cyclotransferase [Nitrosomonas sp.]MCP5242233.1 glutaminyl-peptide cyclotransferase [Burkholderiales bacterium]MDR4514185.1 glutaminyl-peptide cyclotransferase [Nitrosomonas sp.]